MHPLRPKRILTTSKYPWRQAIHRGELPSAFTLLISTVPADKIVFTALTSPVLQADHNDTPNCAMRSLTSVFQATSIASLPPYPEESQHRPPQKKKKRICWRSYRLTHRIGSVFQQNLNYINISCLRSAVEYCPIILGSTIYIRARLNQKLDNIRVARCSSKVQWCKLAHERALVLKYT
jgi:hypothetical protein